MPEIHINISEILGMSVSGERIEIQIKIMKSSPIYAKFMEKSAFNQILIKVGEIKIRPFKAPLKDFKILKTCNVKKSFEI